MSTPDGINDGEQALACWRRFNVAASTLRCGSDVKARALIERVRARSGDYAANTARRELYAFAGVKPERDELERANRILNEHRSSRSWHA